MALGVRAGTADGYCTGSRVGDLRRVHACGAILNRQLIELRSANSVDCMRFRVAVAAGRVACRRRIGPRYCARADFHCRYHLEVQGVRER